jgi:hypothetical protein
VTISQGESEGVDGMMDQRRMVEEELSPVVNGENGGRKGGNSHDNGLL